MVDIVGVNSRWCAASACSPIPAGFPPLSFVFPITDLLSERECYRWFESILCPDGPACPKCGLREGVTVHSLRRPDFPLLYCKPCRKVFNIFTGTLFHGSKRSLRELVLIVRGFLQGVSTSQLAKELECDPRWLLAFRRKFQDSVFWRNYQRPKLDGPVHESDEMYQNAGEKRKKARRSGGSSSKTREQEARPRRLRG